MSATCRCRVYIIALAAVMLLACQIGPRSPEPTATFAAQSAPTQTATIASGVTETPLPRATPTRTPGAPTLTPSPTATALPAAHPPTPTPPLPDAGDLPAQWIDLDFGIAAGDLYYPGSLALDAQAGVVYALGQCELEPAYETTGPPAGPGACLSRLDLESDRVVAQAQLAASASSDLVLAGETLYVNQSWSGALLALDAATLRVQETISDVQQVAYDGQGAAYAATVDGIMRLAPDRAYRPFSWTVEGSSSSIMAIEATAERVYVLGTSALWLFDMDLAPIQTIGLESCWATALALDENRLYVGCSEGLYVLDLATERLERMPVEVRHADRLATGTRDGELIAIVPQVGDWFGGTDVVTIDTTTWQTQTLFSTLSGWLPDLVVDQARNRLLVASYEDHALIPIDLASGQVEPRLPLGIQVLEVVVDQAADRLYASDSAGWVHILDRHTYDEIGSFYGGRSISLDARHRRLYAGDERSLGVLAYDVDAGESLYELPQPGIPRADPGTGQVAIVNRRFYLFDGETGQPAGELLPGIGVPSPEYPWAYYTVGREVVFDPQRGLTATLTYTPWPGKPGPQESIAVEPASGRAYYALLTGGYVHYSSIQIYADLGALQRTLRPSAARPGDAPLLTLEGLSGYLALDAADQRLYVARGEMLFVLDSTTLKRIGRVDTTGWVPRIAALDEGLGRLYTPHASQLAVWTRTGGAEPVPQPHVTMAITGTVAAILPSPNFARDNTLLATIHSRLCRSTDGGATWQRLRGGLPELAYGVLSVEAAFSPDYANDQTILAGIAAHDSHGEGVWASHDGGGTWQPANDGLYHLRVYRVVFSPDYANDRTLLAYAHTPSGDALYQSRDRGANWSLLVQQASTNRPPLPRPEDLFWIEQHAPRFQCDYNGACERSDDGGATWTPFETGGVPLDRLVATAVSPQFDVDDTAYFLTESGLYRARLRQGVWQRCTAPFFDNRDHYSRALTSLAVAATGAGQHTLFVGSTDGGFYHLDGSDARWWEKVEPAPTVMREPPTVTREPPTPVPCPAVPEARPVDERFHIDYANLPQKLGCAVESGKSTWAAFQPFERGSMLWRQDTQEIDVLHDDGTWRAYEDTWDESQPTHDPDLVPPAGLYQPMRGFGKVWREQPGVEAGIGWATEGESGLEAVIQVFNYGLLLKGREDDRLTVLYYDWQWETIDLRQGD